MHVGLSITNGNKKSLKINSTHVIVTCNRAEQFSANSAEHTIPDLTRHIKPCIHHTYFQCIEDTFINTYTSI